MEKVRRTDVLIFATPFYYYEMSGQMKTLLDRVNPLYESGYMFQDVCMIETAADGGEMDDPNDTSRHRDVMEIAY